MKLLRLKISRINRGSWIRYWKWYSIRNYKFDSEIFNSKFEGLDERVHESSSPDLIKLQADHGRVPDPSLRPESKPPHRWLVRMSLPDLKLHQRPHKFMQTTSKVFKSMKLWIKKFSIKKVNFKLLQFRLQESNLK